MIKPSYPTLLRAAAIPTFATPQAGRAAARMPTATLLPDQR
jgi:hypothetical protein